MVFESPLAHTVHTMPLIPSKGALKAHCTIIYYYVLEGAIARLHTRSFGFRGFAPRACTSYLCARTQRGRCTAAPRESTNHPPHPSMYAYNLSLYTVAF